MHTTGSLATALAAGPVVLDGGLATELEAQGHDVGSALWSARLLRDDPAAVVAAHAAFAAAGAQVATTASYQATVEGFAAAGLDAAAARELVTRSVRLAREGAPDGWVAGSVGPYGAMLADGSEYTGAYLDPQWSGRAGGGLSVAELRDFHRPRMTWLAEAGVDVLAAETLPGAAEAEAVLAEAAALGVPVWLSLTTVTGADGVVRTRRGEPAAAVLAAAASSPGVVAVGVNCTDPAGVLAAVQAAGTPCVVYPNSGEVWDAAGRRWTGRPGLPTADVRAWVAAGARLVGGCCRVSPADVRTVAAALTSTWRSATGEESSPVAPRHRTGQRIGVPPVTATRAPDT
ncbi:homocysteine S-methyltransferase [Modestobacter sp. I12A-02628]|uniref:Homocysteine S-methyltransferase n=1 Tax=Goekera deserti TaxID=2497753 RepID=A0A7K3WHM9_9ACTN|nr:homocysteine S-methyltransferase [Goekera deserti]MPQ99008.1 homocysteine S-methyltransferase [Goekera deserti]NDI47342.1 homocysteine S-methyltransferase [Goekera deserti]NEL55872.1 homocysteine S-methyltransferase [Goekera deserti]